LSLAQLFVLFGLILAWDGFRRFIGKPPVSRLALTVLGATVLIWVAIATLQPSLQLRAQSNAILVVILSALIARELLTASKPIPPAMRATGWAYAINATVFLLRVVAADQNAAPVSPLDPDGFAAIILFWWLCMTIAVTLGMVLMTAERLQEELDSQANHDPLTGALNRRSFSLFAKKAMSQSRRSAKPLSVLMMDLDRFKHINDHLGHNRGDELLCQFVTVANRVLRNEDIFCRFGGEEFIALLPNTSAELALVAAERLRTVFAAESPETVKDNMPSTTTVSIGIAELGNSEDVESFLHRADTALYKAKDKGRNCCELADAIQEMTNSGYLGCLDSAS
jgi:diguanylate cyclase (GGDEF)-like protein